MLQHLVIVTLLGLAHAAIQLPSDIKMCVKTNDLARYNKCARDVIEKLKPHLAKGVPSMQIPVMEPTIYPEVEARRDLGIVHLNAKFMNFEVRGFTNFTILDLHVDPNTLKFNMKVHYDKLAFKSDYDLGGRILIVPLGGVGSLQGEAYDLNMTLTAQGKDVIDENGVLRVGVDKFRMSFQINKAAVKLKSTSIKNYLITRAMEKVFNFNSKLICKTLEPLTDDVASALTKDYVIDSALSAFTKAELIPVA